MSFLYLGHQVNNGSTGPGRMVRYYAIFVAVGITKELRHNITIYVEALQTEEPLVNCFLSNFAHLLFVRLKPKKLQIVAGRYDSHEQQTPTPMDVNCDEFKVIAEDLICVPLMAMTE